MQSVTPTDCAKGILNYSAVKSALPVSRYQNYRNAVVSVGSYITRMITDDVMNISRMKVERSESFEAANAKLQLRSRRSRIVASSNPGQISGILDTRHNTTYRRCTIEGFTAGVGLP